VSNTITQEQIQKFMDAWFLALDQHVPVAECAKFVAEDVEMIFPEKTLHGISDFKAWYAGGTYSDGEQAPGVINIFFDENHNLVSTESDIEGDQAKLRIVVAWQASLFVAPEPKSRRVSLDATQDWTLKPSEQNPYGLVITSYNAMAKPFAYAPGFVRL
jgi:hypothetical protein